ncbi:MAG: Calx-beta domain-containing protein [Candidatus Poribacteria bacterium]|nr:Calx-beta domain-containing protein [Candidatus Poribacteria bacterium]
MAVDKILLTRNSDFHPTGVGPDSTRSGGVIFFKALASGGFEYSSPLEIPVQLSTMQSAFFTVDYRVKGGNDTNEDFTLSPGRLTCAPGENEKDIQLNITDDQLDEDDEQIQIELVNAAGPGVRIGKKATQTFTIFDPRPIIAFERSLSGEFKPVSSIDIPLALSVSALQQVSVDYIVTAISEIQKRNVRLESGVISFAPGEMRKSISTKFTPKITQEENLTVNIALTNPVNAKLGSQRTHMFTCIKQQYIRLRGAFYGRINSGETWESVAKVGPHADVVVRLGDDDDKLVFWRGSSYLPYWETDDGRWYVDEMVPRQGDGTGLQHDKICQYAHVKIVENSLARTVILWRYVPQFDNPVFNGWVEEYCTIYPDGLFVRQIRQGTEPFKKWINPDNDMIQLLMLTKKGIISFSNSQMQPAVLTLSDTFTQCFDYLGFAPTEWAYILKRHPDGLCSSLDFRLDIENKAPIRNPVFVVKDWGDANVKIRVDGVDFGDFKRGEAKHLNGVDLVLWLNIQVDHSVSISILPLEGQTLNIRISPPDPYRYDIPVFPEGLSEPGPFGAYYTHLKYTKLWDELWCVGKYADIVVQFDDYPCRLLFWRGTGNVPHWSNEQNRWYSNQFVERGAGDAGLAGCCCEPMQDHECRYSHARIISSHDARAVIHWRYAPCDKYYRHPFVDETGWGDWIDEYYTIYPDTVSVRKATLYTSEPDKFNE